MKTIIQYPNFKKKTLNFGQVKCFSYDQGLMDEINAGLAPEDALFMYRQMLYIRAFETMIVKLRSGEIVPCDGFRFSGATHLSIGQEAVAVGANAALRPDDYITSSHRGHGHGIAKSSYALKAMSQKELQAFIRSVRFQSVQENLLEQALEVHLYRTMAEFLGKKEGYCRGRGGSMHIADFYVGHLGANAIVGGSIPIATGAGMSIMLQGSDKVVLCFFGDGAANNGVFGESLNMACMAQYKDWFYDKETVEREKKEEGYKNERNAGGRLEKEGAVKNWSLAEGAVGRGRQEEVQANGQTKGGRLEKEGAVKNWSLAEGAVGRGRQEEVQANGQTKGGRFRRGAPVIYLIENNQFGMTGRGAGEVTGIDYLARRGWGYNEVGMHAEVVNGMDVLAVREAVLRAAQLCRAGEGPVLLEAMTYRYVGHSLSDQNLYRQKEEIEAWRCEDAIGRMKQELVKAQAAGPAELEEIERQVDEQMERITIAAAKSAYPEAGTIYEGLYSDTTSEMVPAEYRTTDYNAEEIKDYRDSEGRMPYRRAVLEAMVEEMVRDKRVVFYGEDVAEHGGAFAATAGLLEVFGRERVFNTAISEAAICGSAVGMAATGLRPIMELMYIDFILMSMDQLGNQAAKNKYMFGGKAVIPMVCRTTIGGGKGYAGQHSQSLEAIATQMPGLKVVAPSTPADVKGLLKTAIRDDNPVIFIEHQLLYGERGVVPRGEYLIPLGKAAIRREGQDVTIIAYSYMAKVAGEAAELLAAKGVSAEVIDIRSLIPLDEETIVESIKKTNYGCVLSQAPGTGCFGEHIINVIQAKAFDYLDAPVELVAAHEVPPPMAPTLEAENMPSGEKVAARVMAMLGRD